MVSQEFRMINPDHLLETNLVPDVLIRAGIRRLLASTLREKSHPGVEAQRAALLQYDADLKKRGIAFVRSKVGDRYVLEELEKQQWILGGEGSGHLLALDKHTTGDGLVSALQVLQACVSSGKRMRMRGPTAFGSMLSEFIPVPLSRDQSSLRRGL